MKKYVESKYRFPLNLQLFADGDGDDNQDNNSDDDKTDNDKLDDKDKEAAFTPEQQTKIDALIAKTIAKERAKRDKEIEAAKTEAEKLAQMNADQKAEYERTKREDELAKREGEITRRELRAQALESLAEKGLPKQLANILVYADAESTNNSIDAVEKSFREAVEAAVNERLKGPPPKGGGGQQIKGYDAGKSMAEQRNQKGSGKE
ncbi:DUF4355 domain-containing protein [Paenibacillus apiarius]|uniref:DUF4355 domain-containing protein n=1 Tax=Paenibacillus apiarius TaxID=46240 RepID=A0ABT4DQS5_9BACL|nr:DUF4355 domain-containing protein [Paenibacillus apiarius]MCY9513306.1 DUF4355 domain-containing protein [Paenibacillus apiarius]MCY9519722.1 DUF4355 domain-containing protein [Paenibacillus apiarius]MCY9553222.1 DUF4355 domain-containing protein [Paenibacillus apiarius]MCY9557072.1 DUF4355 domain-containing protein [Paenibacillus apiarius]MCY9682187.1 DUF4355 domain-containing protein [Paenibacillus apiarius]